MINTYTSIHCHSEYSSAVLRFTDSIGKVKDIVNYAYDLGLNGISISDHQTVAGYVDLEQAINKLAPSRHFQHIFGNEFYLISEDEEQQRVDNDIKPQYWHYLLTVLDEEGLHQMYELSARAWLRSYTYRGILRRPSFYSDIEEVIGKNPGHIVGSNACIGGYLPQHILSNESNKVQKFLNWNQQVFGKNNFFLECQPCLKDNEEQLKVNKSLWEIHEKQNIPIIVTTDIHFLRPEQRYIHTALLKSKDGGDSREPEKFYQTTYLFSPQELRETLYVSDFNDAQIDVMFQTTNDISDRVQPITLKKKTLVPGLPYLPKFKIKHYYKEYYPKFEYIDYYANSENEHEKYYYFQIEQGLYNYQKTHNIDLVEYLKQINTEMEQVKKLGETFDGQHMCDYFTVVQKIVDLIWSDGDSYVGIGRGSGGCFLTNFLLGITGINPLLPETKEFYPWWRFCSVARSDSIMDIDTDIQSFKKEQIIQAIKNYFGERQVCQVVTWGKLTSKTALERAGKGLGIPDDTIAYIKSLIPVKRGAIYSLKDCTEGNIEKSREKIPEFINEVNKYPGLLETAMALEGMKISSGVHAGALNVLQNDFTYTGSLMVSSNGTVTSQFDLHQAEYAGDLKMDLLSIDCLQIIRTCMDLLQERGYIESKGSLRDTYNYYLGYDNIEKDNKDMWKELSYMPSAFQYDSRAGKEALNKIGASNLTELTLANGLMRLAIQDGEQPMDKYIRYRNNIEEWYQDMQDYGLREDEIELLKELLGNYCGLMISQSTTMSVLMDERVCGFTLKESDKARKSISKKDAIALAETEKNLYNKGYEKGHSKEFLDYLWKVQIEMSKSYAFDFSHSHEYSTECLQELNLYHFYPKIYWNAAVVITQAQTEDERNNVTTTINYGKIAQSIYKARENNIYVSAPSINESGLTFTISQDEQSILFGLAAISGINISIANQIIQNRSYTSFKDFYQKNSYEGSLVTQTKFIQLIKAGCFDEFEPNRLKVMKQYIALSTAPRKSLTTANLPEAIKNKCKIPENLLSAYNFKQYVCSKKFLYGNHPNFKSKKIYWLDDWALQQFNNYINSLKENTDYFYQDDLTLVVDKSLEKLLKPQLDSLKEFINTPEFLKEFNICVLNAKFNQLVPNRDTNHWSFEACSFFSNEHELAHINKEKYNVSLFNELPNEPIFITKTSKNGREWKQYMLSQIAGVVLAKNDNNHLLTVLDINNNVVQCKFNAIDYAKYKAQISNEDGVQDTSWFKRGTALILAGVKVSESDFRVRSQKNSIYQNKVKKIIKINNSTGDITMVSKRYGEE